MAWIATDKNGDEYIYDDKPDKNGDIWFAKWGDHCMTLPKGSIKKLIGRDLTWEDEPVELK